MFKGLGKPTKRGVKKCPKCGTNNGSRSHSCKNRNCDAIFKSATVDPKQQSHPSKSFSIKKLITEFGNVAKTLFSVRKLSDPNELGFVLICVSDSSSSSSSSSFNQEDNDWPNYNKCYVQKCPRSLSLLKDSCLHIRACQGTSEPESAEPLTVKQSVLNQLSISSDLKQEIWVCANKGGPLVQRISKDVMVVRSRKDHYHPLGYVHLMLNPSDTRFICSCSQAEGDDALCIHFYACLVVFGSDETLSNEFSSFLNFAQQNITDLNKVIAIIDENSEIEVLDIENLNRILSESEVRFKSDDLEQPSSNEPDPKIENFEELGSLMNEDNVSWTFKDWLPSVTEKINSTMHYNFSGNPDPLAFVIPHDFFRCFRARLCDNLGKKQLPISINVIQRRDRTPVGTFTKYVWHLINVMQVKKVFDTSQAEIELTKIFFESTDGKYYLKESDIPPKKRKTGSECKTILKTGVLSRKQAVPYPFVIEWIPNIFGPQMPIGELSLIFQFGHLKNNELVVKS